MHPLLFKIDVGFQIHDKHEPPEDNIADLIHNRANVDMLIIIYINRSRLELLAA
jgi:hypothetical protein